FVYGSATLAQYLINRARSFIFSTAMLPAQAAAAERALGIAAEEPDRRERVRKNIELLNEPLLAAGASIVPNGTHIVPVVIGDDERVVRIGRALARDVVLVGAVAPRDDCAPVASRLAATALADPSRDAPPPQRGLPAPPIATASAEGAYL